MFNSRNFSFGLFYAFAIMLTACGGDDPAEGGGDGGRGGTGGTGGNQQDDSKLENHAWSQWEVSAEAFPDRDGGNGNESFDPDTVAIELSARLIARVEKNDLDSELPITSATVRVGHGGADASDDEDFEWVTLTHQGEGVYSAELIGISPKYRTEIVGPVIDRASATLETPQVAHIDEPVHGETYPSTAELPVRYSSPESNVMAVVNLDGELVTRGHTNEEKDSLAVPAWRLERGATHQVGLALNAGSIEVSSRRVGGLVFVLHRWVDVEME